MMKRFAFVAFLATGCLTMAAQDTTVEETVEYSSSRHKVETNRFWSNWFVSVGAGGQIIFGDHDKQCQLGDRISPSIDIAVGKWFSPEIGVRLMYNGFSLKGATQDVNGQQGPHSTGKPIDGKPWQGYWLRESKFNYFNLQADVLFNLSNIFAGYNEKRIYDCSPYVGVGVAHVTDAPTETSLSGHFGILNSFRITQALDINLDLRGSLVNDDFDGTHGGRGGEGIISATVGLTYKFKQRGWNRSKTVTRTVYNNAEVNALRDKLNHMSQENARLQEAIARNEREKAQQIVKNIAASYLIVFEIGKSKLSNHSRVNLGMMAEVIKQGDRDAVYTIIGYADAGTGSKAGNERLSKKRAEAVYNCLVEEFGVDENQLKIDYKGGVENMFYDDPRMSRAVILKSK